jgi:hypothetical protein
MLPNQLSVLLSQDPTVIEDMHTAFSALGLRLLAVSSAFEAEKLVADGHPCVVFTELACKEGPTVGADFAKSVRESLGEKCFVGALLRPGNAETEFTSKTRLQGSYTLPVSFPHFVKDLQAALEEYFV